jgi:hypothetical protein
MKTLDILRSVAATNMDVKIWPETHYFILFSNSTHFEYKSNIDETLPS